MKKIGLVLAVLVLASCTRSGEQGSSASSNAPKGINFKTSTNEFVLNGRAEPDFLDPHRTWAHDSAQIINQLYEGLLSREADYVTVRPGIAKEWSVSTDGLTYTFVLRDGVKWSNGEPITIDQVRGSLLRAMDPKVAAPYIKWYEDFVEGAEAFVKAFNSPQRAEAEKNLGIRIDGNKLLITLKKPISYFKYLVAQTPFFIIHPSMYDPSSPAWTDPKSFISNGAFQLSEWRVNDRVVMTKNPNFYEASQVALDRVTFVILTEQAATFNMFQAGAIDWTNNNSIDTALVPSLRGREDFHLNPTLGTYMSVFNVTKKPFNDARVRRAFALVVDQALITDKILRSGFQPTHRLVPPVIPGYQSQVPDQPAFDVRLAEAKKLLSEAGYPEGKGFPAVTYKYNTDEQHHKIAQALQAAWQKHLGVSVKLENLEWKVFLSEQKRRNFDVARLGWIGDYPDPATFLELYMTGNENNRSGWSNPQYDELVRSALREQDEKKRFGLYAQAEKIVADEAPMIGIYHYSYFSLINPAVQGFIPNPHGHHLFRFLSKK